MSRFGTYGFTARLPERASLYELMMAAHYIRKHLVAEKKRQNTHNCTQAVTCTYCDLVGLDEQTALDIAGLILRSKIGCITA